MFCIEDSWPQLSSRSRFFAQSSKTADRVFCVFRGRFRAPEGPVVFDEFEISRFSCHTHTTSKIARRRARSFLRKSFTTLATLVLASKKGLRRGYYSGIRGATNRARAAFLGQQRGQNAKNDVFGRTKNAKYFLDRRESGGLKIDVLHRRQLASVVFEE